MMTANIMSVTGATRSRQNHEINLGKSMKSSTGIFTAILLIILVGGAAFYAGRKSALRTATTADNPATAAESNQLAAIQPIVAEPITSAPVISPKPVQAEPSPVATAKESTTDESAFNQALGMLTSTNATYRQKIQVWQQLRDAGQLDQALAALKEKAVANPADAAYPTALGEGYYAKLQSVYKQGDSSAVAMLALQTDQSFNDALKIDPANWEAQYVKANALSHWPAEMNKGPEVIQQLSSLIDQQDGVPAKPEFAQSYALLGDQFKKLGDLDKAAATWQLGLQKFPNDPALLKKINEP